MLKDFYLTGVTGIAIIFGGFLLAVLIYAVGRHFSWWQPVWPRIVALKDAARSWLGRWVWVPMLGAIPAALACPRWISALGLALIGNAFSIFLAGHVRAGCETYWVLLVYLLAAVLLVLGLLVSLVGLFYAGPQ